MAPSSAGRAAPLEPRGGNTFPGGTAPCGATTRVGGPADERT
eukprot:CAMPEP_0119094110 /NCGR_PEP_ID=MMETSP1178-20130426/165216_1 /TAXON_ID=33656 /ORGANISM="unid sp, Strain CCMP2000" /LENGTH=41 /DNA_ID= /DNA_START= /DNA_END= /DNA_ORIENTATION=